MTSPPGYRRLTPSAESLRSQMWAWIRTRRRPWTVAALADAVGAADRSARHYVAGLAHAGYLQCVGLEGGDGGQIAARRWQLVADTGRIAPRLLLAEGAIDLNSGMTGRALARIRRNSGISVQRFALAVLKIRDARTARRYETLDTVPAPAAERVRAWLETGR